MMELELDGWCHGPLFKSGFQRRALVRPKGWEGRVRRGQEKRATPPWANLPAIRALKREARRLTLETGELHVVDHIIPLIGKMGGVQVVSGLHVHYNMRVIPAGPNAQKGAWYWPDMPFEQMELEL